MPYAFSFRLPSLLIQSVVHAGVRTRSVITLENPCNSSASITLDSINSVAGQPVYVGAIPTVTESASTLTDRKMPRSASVRTGISGSGNSLRIAQTSCSEDSLDAVLNAVSGQGLPGRAGVGALKELHLRQQVTEMLSVLALSAARCHPYLIGFAECGLLKCFCNNLRPGTVEF